MKIAFFSDVFPPYKSGVVISIVNFSKYLAKRGNEIFIFTSKQSKKEKLNLGKKIHVFYYPAAKLVTNPDFRITFPNYISFLRKIKEIKPDIIHIHTPLLSGWCALAIGAKYKIPIVNTYNTRIPDFLKYIPLPAINKTKIMENLSWSYTRKFYNKSDVIIAPSAVIKNELKKYRIKKNIVVISNGVDLKKFYPIKKEKKGNTILHIGRIGYEKKIDILIKAFRELQKKDKNAKLVIAGKGPDLNKLKKYARKLNIKNITFLGEVAHENLPALYSSADVFATASTMETEGIVILEAMACGLPIVGVNKLAVPSIVRHNKNGFIAKVDDYKKIAQYINILLTNKKLNKKFSKNSLKLIKNFSLEKCVDKLEKLYKDLSKRKERAIVEI